MKRTILVVLSLWSIFFTLSDVSSATTVTVSPASTTVNQNVSINASATFAGIPVPPNSGPCFLDADFGDLSPVFTQTCTTDPCILSIAHSYSSPSVYTVTATARCPNSVDNSPDAPEQASTSVSIGLSPSSLTVSPIPSSFNIARGQSSTKTVMYQFTGGPSLNVELNSASGSFLVGGKVIDTNPTPLRAVVRNGLGTFSEAILVPVRAIERAIQSGTTRISYVRTFSAFGVGYNATVNLTVTSATAADFSIRRMELYFKNRRAEITVERNSPGLKAYADIQFTGSGLLEGYWEVDGRILSVVQRHLTYAGSATLQTPDIPPLPTFDTGTHIVRFVVNRPINDIPLPSILYFVTPAESRAKPLNIKLVSPEDASSIDYTPTTFEWEEANQSTLYLIQYFEAIDSKPIFSAYTRHPFYNLPEFVLNKIMSPGLSIYWKVTGFDSENNVISESTYYSVNFLNAGLQ